MRYLRNLLPKREGDILPDLPTLRDQIVRFCASYSFLIATPLIVTTIYRAITVDWLWSTYLQIALYCLLGVTVVFQKRIGTPTIAAVLLLTALLGGASGVATWGLLANDASLFVGFTVLAALFLGAKWSLLFVLLSTAISFFVGQSFVLGTLNYQFDEVAYLRTSAPWTNRAVHIAMIGVLVSLSICWITRSLQKTILALKQRETELEHSNTLLQQQTVQLEEQAVLLEEQAEGLKVERDKAKSASRAKDQFLSVVSHELRTPLNPVLGFIDILKQERALSEEGRNQLDLMQGSSEHLLLMIDQIVDFSEIDRDELITKPHRTNLAELQREISFRLANEAKANRLDFQIHCSLPPETDISIDKKRVLQTITEVGNNAIKFTFQGHVHVGIDLKRTDVQNVRNLCIEITDTGIGIPPDKIADIFDPFSQAETDRTRTFGGFGLGLAMCDKILKALGGSIALESKPDHGTTATIQIPTTILPPRDAKKPRPRFDKPFEILVVEDDITNQKVVTSLLKRMGARTTCAGNGRIALETLASTTFDAILMDLSMPEMDGITATQKIRQNPDLSHIPIIALTAHYYASSESQCYDAGMNDFLTKPVKTDKLFDALTRTLSQQEAGNN